MVDAARWGARALGGARHLPGGLPCLLGVSGLFGGGAGLSDARALSDAAGTMRVHLIAVSRHCFNN